MKRSMAVILSILLLTCSAALVNAEEKFNLQLAVTSSPNSNFMKGMEKFKEEVEKLTEGKVTIELHPGGALYTQQGQAQAIRRGTLAMTAIGPEWFSDYVPKCAMFSSAYFLKDRNHMDKVFSGEVGQGVFEDIVKELKIRPLIALYYGTRTLNLRDVGVKVQTPGDLKSVSLRMPNSPAFIKMGQALGGNPTPLSFSEVYMGLKTGTIDGQDNPLGTTIEKKFYEVTKYIILTKHFVNPDFVLINEKIWQSLGSDLQGKMITAAETAKKHHDALVVQAENNAIEFLKAEGLEIIEVDIDVWRDYAQKFYLNDEFSKDWDMDFYKKVQELAK